MGEGVTEARLPNKTAYLNYALHSTLLTLTVSPVPSANTWSTH